MEFIQPIAMLRGTPRLHNHPTCVRLYNPTQLHLSLASSSLLFALPIALNRLLTTVLLPPMARMNECIASCFISMKIWRFNSLPIHQLKENSLIDSRRNWSVYVLPLFSPHPFTASNKMPFTLGRRWLDSIMLRTCEALH